MNNPKSPILKKSPSKAVNSLTLNAMAKECHRIAVEKGFWDTERNIGEALMLIVTELAEAMEAYRVQNDENFKEEIADTFIRLFDLCGGLNIDIEKEIAKKSERNKNRPYRHGKIC
ncbi:MAG TPA: nucleotide pyrophosphohydrolase [Candidatus Omnitrophota bacterium]|nr:nucleotide pyrophosphohydrolase [Candidatus Omnitrophota bacterium]HPD83890.1 nucleotide pyrophosphohydrolase [Candidatus Omnitrophota bacterium]HRZ02747.1 nucleotide pyrophosphohydrolase [Candidatus Omnitrophota bacterium]